MSQLPPPRDTLITVQIGPLTNGKRKVLVSGAPEKEMPVVRVGTFAEMHDLLNEVWLALQTRDPQLVTVKEPKKATATKPTAAKDNDDEDKSETAEDGSGAVDAVRADGNTDSEFYADKEPVSDPDLQNATAAPQALPAIEGDTASAAEPVAEVTNE